MATAGRRAYNRLLAAAGDPEAAQARTLQNILASLASTEVGRRYGYGTIKDADAFRAAVPVHDYEALRPFIDRQIATGEPVITASRPVMYARTSGTTGHPKMIPVTAEVVTGLREAQRAMAYVQHSALGAFRGHVLAIAGAVREETLPDGTPAGATTGLVYQTMPRIIRAKYVLPAEVFAHRGLRSALCRHRTAGAAVSRPQRYRHGQPIDHPAADAPDRGGRTGADRGPGRRLFPASGTAAARDRQRRKRLAPPRAGPGASA